MNIDIANIEARIEEFLKAAQEKVTLLEGDDTPDFCRTKLSVMKGKRYARIVKHNPHQSVFCFIDKTNGNVLKAAGWKAPAPQPRSNIFNDDLGMSGITQYGAVYIG